MSLKRRRRHADPISPSPIGPARETSPARGRWAERAALAVVLLLATTLLTTQVRIERSINRAIGIRSTRLDDLGYRLQREDAAREALEQQVAVLREQTAELARVTSEGRENLRQLTVDLDRLRTLGGLTAVTGPGIVVAVRDNPRTLGRGEDPNDALVHYTDLRAIVNDLFAAGAEAIAINEERFTVTSALMCVGTTVLLNGKRLAPPFRIEAIGDPELLKRFVLREGGTVGLLKAYAFPVAVAAGDRLILPPYRGAFPPIAPQAAALKQTLTPR